MTRIPAFFFRRVVSADEKGTTLVEGDGFSISRHKGKTTLWSPKPWRSEFLEFYRHHNVDSIEIPTTYAHHWTGFSLDFLRDLPSLLHLSLGIDVPLDLSPLADLEGLESLSLEWRATEPPAELDFRRFGRLFSCAISWTPSFASALGVETLRILNIFDAKKLKVLDLRGLPRLVELGLNGCAALDRIELSDQARLVALELINCGKFRPVWDRLATDLCYLCVMGRLGFPVEELVAAQNLEFLWAEVPSRKYSWTFLHDLPSLKAIRLIDMKISEEVAQIVRSINEANGHGPTLGAPPA
jgi:hypothetical protein